MASLRRSLLKARLPPAAGPSRQLSAGTLSLTQTATSSSTLDYQTRVKPSGRCNFSTSSSGSMLPLRAEYQTLKNIQHKRTWLEALAQRDQPPPKPATVNGDGSMKLDLTPKRMMDSYFCFSLPFSKDEWLIDSYVNANGQLRLGTLFQDLDALAGKIAYAHTGEGPTTVTAAVDRISIISPLSTFCDLELSGFVSYVGRSSMEVTIEVKKKGNGSEGELFMTCAFTMVALDPATKRPIAVPPLILETEAEKEIFRRGEEYKMTKQALAKQDLHKQTPNDEESDLIHDMWMQNQKYQDPRHPTQPPENMAYMSTTVMSSTQIMQPQYRNRHSYMIFGGFLLSETFELAFCCASAFARSRPRFISLDPSTFQSPVPVGSILYLTASVAYTEDAGTGTRIQVRVASKVKDVEHGNVLDTGVFNYTFWVDRDVAVMPVTYSEFIQFIDARRRAKRQSLIAGIDDGRKDRVNE